MTTDHDFDRIAKAWLADGPDELPDRVIDAAVDQIHLTRQRRAGRIPWRLPDMTTPVRVAAGTVFVVLLVGGAVLVFGRPDQGAVGSGRSSPAVSSSPSRFDSVAPSPSVPGAGPAVPALTEVFTSPRHGYSIRYPAGWATTPGSGPWTTGVDTLYRDPALDAIESDEALLAAASTPLGAGQTPDQWLAPYCRSGASAGGPCGREITIGGVTGYVSHDGVPAEGGTVATGGRIFSAAVVTGGRGYSFTLDGHVDQALFDALLSSVTFDPSAARD